MISKKILNRLRWLSLIGLGIVFFNFLAYGSSIEVNPVRLQMLPGQKITSFEITNYSGAQVVLQLSAVRWTKVFGKDRHEETKDVVITPPLMHLNPQEKQLVRIGITTPPNAKKGETYRIIIKEVPSSNVMPSLSINTLLEIRVPLVVAPLVPSQPKIIWKVTRSGAKKLTLSLQNVGESYISLHGISLSNKNEKKPFVEKPISYYILPSQKQEYEFDLPNSLKKSDVEIKADTDQGEITAIVPITGH